MSPGRPTLYTTELVTEVCRAIATSSKGLARLCEDHPHWPNRTTLLEWLGIHSHFADMYAQAKEAQADFMLEECSEIADDGSADYVVRTGRDGREDLVVDQEALGRSRLRVDTRLKVIEKLAPRKYGAMAKIELTGTLNVNTMTDEEIAAELAALAASGVLSAPEEPEDASDLV